MHRPQDPWTLPQTRKIIDWVTLLGRGQMLHPTMSIHSMELRRERDGCIRVEGVLMSLVEEDNLCCVPNGGCDCTSCHLHFPLASMYLHRTSYHIVCVQCLQLVAWHEQDAFERLSLCMPYEDLLAHIWTIHDRRGCYEEYLAKWHHTLHKIASSPNNDYIYLGVHTHIAALRAHWLARRVWRSWRAKMTVRWRKHVRAVFQGVIGLDDHMSHVWTAEYCKM